MLTANGGPERPAGMTELAQRSLQVAKVHLGQQELKGMQNHGQPGGIIQRVQRWIGAWAEGQPWCVMFALWCIHHAAATLGTSSILPKTASSSTLYAWMKRRNLLLSGPVSGCIGFVRGGRTGHSHTFLVHEVRRGPDGAPRRVVGVDGNWKNAVSWSERIASACDYGKIC